MIQFHIEAPDKGLEAALQDKIDNLTKPKGSLGTLEALALQVGLIQQTLSPVLRHPVNVIYASDHGIADEGVSKSPKEVTRQVIDRECIISGCSIQKPDASACPLIVITEQAWHWRRNERRINGAVREGTVRRIGAVRVDGRHN